LEYAYRMITDGRSPDPTITRRPQRRSPDYHPRVSPPTEAVPPDYPTRRPCREAVTRLSPDAPRRRSPDYRLTQLCARLTELPWDAPRSLRHGMVPRASSSSSRDLSSRRHRYRCLSSCPPRACMRGGLHAWGLACVWACMRVGMRGACMRGGSHARGGGHRSRGTAARPRACVPAATPRRVHPCNMYYSQAVARTERSGDAIQPRPQRQGHHPRP